MKVLLVGNDLSVKGGITTVIKQILDYNWKKENIDLKFIPTYIDKSNNKKIIFFIVAFLRICFCMIFNKPDLVHIHVSYKGSFYRKLVIQKICKMFKVKNIVHLHGSEFKVWYDSLEKKGKILVKNFIKNSDSFIVLGEMWKKNILEIEPDANILIIKNSIKLSKSIVKWNNDIFKFVFVGMLIKRKGIFDLIEVFKDIKEEKILTKNVQLIICGTGPEENELRKMVDKYRIDNIVKFLGWIDVDDKKKLLNDCQTLILPSYNEGLPMAILEAINYGMPVIATNVGDVSSAVFDEKNGFLIEPGNKENLKKSIYRICNDKKMFLKMNFESKKIVKKFFSEEIFFTKIKRCYYDLCEKGRR